MAMSGGGGGGGGEAHHSLTRLDARPLNGSAIGLTRINVDKRVTQHGSSLRTLLRCNNDLLSLHVDFPIHLITFALGIFTEVSE